MNKRLQFILALICASLATLGLFFYLNQVEAEANNQRSEALARYGGELVEVLVTNDELPAGTILNEENTSKLVWLVDLLPSQAIVDASEALGKSLKHELSKNMPITKNAFAQTPSIEIPAGHVALSVSSKGLTSVGGLLRPGMHIDVYSSSDEVSLLAQNILVVQTSASHLSDELTLEPIKIEWLTLAVKPELVEALIAAESKKSLYFVLPGESHDK
ncbi:MAG: Flp pilus assembly protein CpaB [Coriobacteriia bacterium]|nr:Flp pilus assembly protein CpaB [Coriobacteriia bacterium]